MTMGDNPDFEGRLTYDANNVSLANYIMGWFIVGSNGFVFKANSRLWIYVYSLMASLTQELRQ